MFLNPPPGVIDANIAAPVSRRYLTVVVLTALTLFALYFATARSIVSLWNSSETFAHGYVILPISLWLIWRRRDNFKLYPARPWAPALLLLAALGAGWFAAELGEVQVVAQYAFVAMFPVIALTLFGPKLAGSLAFPLAFMLFAVPFGEIFVAPLIQFTADFTVAAVQATGIPVLRSGSHFELPTGNWSVVEACSGVRYLISSITLGCLYAYLTYRSTLRRALFIGLSVVVPVIANGLRAYMIVMIGHLSGMELATGVDHLIYGWLFFGLVMFIMFWIGSFWREDTGGGEAPLPSAAPAAARRAFAAAQPAPGRLAVIVAATLALSALWPALALLSERANHNAAPVRLPEIAVSWPQAAEFASWKPAYMEPDARFHRVYRDGALPLGLTVLYYRNQNASKRLISSVNRVAAYEDRWHETESQSRVESLAGRAFKLHEGIVEAPEGKIMVWIWKRIGGHDTSNDYLGKLWQAKDMALLRGDDGAAIMLSVPYERDKEVARATLRRFLAEQGKALDQALETTRTR